MNLEEKRMEWAERDERWKQSGSSVAGWCREHGLKVHQMYYLVRKFEEKAHIKGRDANTQWLVVCKNRFKTGECPWFLTTTQRNTDNTSILAELFKRESMNNSGLMFYPFSWRVIYL